MNKIKQLEKQLELAKKDKDRKDWKRYLNQTEAWIKTLVGKSFIKLYSGKSLCIFRVSGYTKKYYTDIAGFYGDWHQSRWFEWDVFNIAVSNATATKNLWDKWQETIQKL